MNPLTLFDARCRLGLRDILHTKKCRSACQVISVWLMIKSDHNRWQIGKFTLKGLLKALVVCLRSNCCFT